MVDTILWWIGAIVIILLGLALIAYLIFWTAKAWIKASMAWRGIVKAESLIYEYKQDFELFQQWKKERLEALKDGK